MDAKYEKADLNAVIADNSKHLSVPDQEKLLKLLTKFEDLFDGTLGVWDTEPVSLKLKEGENHTTAGRFQLQKPVRKPSRRRCKGYVS